MCNATVQLELRRPTHSASAAGFGARRPDGKSHVASLREETTGTRNLRARPVRAAGLSSVAANAKNAGASDKAVARLDGSAKKKKKEEDVGFFMQCLPHIITIFFLMYPQVTNKAFESFSCYNFPVKPATLDFEGKNLVVFSRPPPSSALGCGECDEPDEV